MSPTRFAFVQFEFGWVLGPPDGRYVLRAAAPPPSAPTALIDGGDDGEPGAAKAEHVLVIATLGATERRHARRRRRPKDAGELEAPTVPTTRVTVIHADPFADDAAANAWRAGAEAEDEAARAIVVLDRVLAAHRVATADPTVRDVSRDAALAVRVGIGSGEQVAHGQWAEAVALAPAPDRVRDRRTESLRSHERLAAVLGGRDVVLACEELVLRARADLGAERHREAALQVRVALEAAIADLAPWAAAPSMGDRIAELRHERPAVGEAANLALRGPLPEDVVVDVRRVVAALEGALRARTAAALGD